MMSKARERKEPMIEGGEGCEGEEAKATGSSEQEPRTGSSRKRPAGVKEEGERGRVVGTSIKARSWTKSWRLKVNATVVSFQNL